MMKLLLVRTIAMNVCLAVSNLDLLLKCALVPVPNLEEMEDRVVKEIAKAMDRMDRDLLAKQGKEDREMEEMDKAMDKMDRDLLPREDQADREMEEMDKAMDRMDRNLLAKGGKEDREMEVLSQEEIEHKGKDNYRVMEIIGKMDKKGKEEIHSKEIMGLMETVPIDFSNGSAAMGVEIVTTIRKSV